MLLDQALTCGARASFTGKSCGPAVDRVVSEQGIRHVRSVVEHIATLVAARGPKRTVVCQLSLPSLSPDTHAAKWNLFVALGANPPAKGNLMAVPACIGTGQIDRRS
jgi:hypothetical protein